MSSSASVQDTLQESFISGSSFLTPESRHRPLQTFLFGYPISHSLAPLLHATLFRSAGLPWTYSLHETQDASEFLPALKRPAIVGCAVTMPYKVTMMSLVDEVTDDGRIIGAINTVFLRRAADGSTRYIGTNTDCIGVRDSFLHSYPEAAAAAAGKPAMVIGGGGACRAAIYALWRYLGASKVYMVNRLDSEITAIAHWFADVGFDVEIVHVSTVEQAQELETPALVVGTVPDLPPKEPGEVRAREIVNLFLARPEKGCILEMCYHPRPYTELYGLGEAAGWKMIYGTEAMIWQGVAQQVLWAELPEEKFRLDEVHRVIGEAVQRARL